MRMSVTTTSGSVAVDALEQLVVRAARADQLEVGDRRDQARQTVAQQDVVLGDDHPDRHRPKTRRSLRCARVTACDSRARRRGGRRRAERAGGGDHAGRRRAFGARRRGGADDRWRRADGRADAARLPSRRVLGDPSAGRRARRCSASCALERHGLRWLHPEIALAHPLPDGRRRRAGATSTPRPQQPRVTTARAGSDTIGSLAERWDGAGADACWPRCCGRRATRCRLARFGIPALAPATRAPAHGFDTDEARGPVRRLCRPLVPAARPAAHGQLRPRAAGVGATPSGGRSAEGGSQAIVDALAASLRELGGTIEVDRPTCARWPTCRPPASVLFDTAPAAAGDDRRRPRCRPR